MENYTAYQLKNIKEMLETSSIVHKDKIAFYQKYNKEFKKITYGQLKEDVDALGTALIDMGLKDKRIAVIGKNSYEWVISYLATVCGVGIVVPLDKQLADNEIKNCIQRADINTIIYADEFDKRLKNMSHEINVKNYISMNEGSMTIEQLITRGKQLIKEGRRNFVDCKVNSEGLTSLLFTSGTTSASKVVMLSHKNIMSVINAGGPLIETDKNDVFFSVLPLSHTFECTCGLLYPLTQGAAVAYGDNLKNLMRDIQTVKPTAMMIVPRLAEVFYEKIIDGIAKKNKINQVKITMCLTNILGKYGITLKRKIFKEVHDQFGGNLKLLLLGGAPVNPKISKYLRDLGIMTLQGYGLTECAPLVTLNSNKKFKDDSAGVVIPGSEVIIANPDEEGIGEIAVKGPQVMLGYYEDKKATNEVIRDGFFYTGDLGKFDRKGFLKISGRSKNVIVSQNGKNIYPEEIETLINENQMIKESIVYERVMPNNNTCLTAEVVVTDSIQQKIDQHPEYKEEVRQKLLEYLKEVNSNLSEYKRVHDLQIRSTDFDKTSTLKIKRFVMPK